MTQLKGITEQELKAITIYRKDYAENTDDYCCAEYVDSETLLKVWESNKSEFLFKLFGDKLLIDIPIEYKKSYDDLLDEFYDKLNDKIKHKAANEFLDEYKKCFNEKRALREISDDEYYCFADLISDDSMITNIYSNSNFTFTSPKTHKKIRIESGCKIIKALGKVVDAFDLSKDRFEQFRIMQSQVLNQKTLNGTLTLSIHPLDYMTMSDNECGWESCMSWRYNGGYKQGTVEMMNSPYVVVAYLNSETPMNLYTGTPDNLLWSNKKWRSLFIVHEQFIASVKDYPYANDDLTKRAFEELRKLAETNLGWNYDENLCIKSFHDPIEINDKEFTFHFTTDMMYNDFGSRHCHFMCFNPNFDIDKENWEVPFYRQKRLAYARFEGPALYFNYSGPAQCMICGEVTDNFDNEGRLSCNACEEIFYCDCCEETCGEIHIVDDMRLCSYCYENHVRYCESCHESHYDENMREIYIVPKLSQEEQDKFRKRENERLSALFNTTRAIPENHKIVYINTGCPDLCLCDSGNCIEAWTNQFLIAGASIHAISLNWETFNFVYFEDLNEQTRKSYFSTVDPQEFRDIYTDSAIVIHSNIIEEI